MLISKPVDRAGKIDLCGIEATNMLIRIVRNNAIIGLLTIALLNIDMNV